MDAIYIGVDFHARQQTICYLKTETGELVTCELKHQDKEAVRAFYAQFQGLVIVGLEASGYSPWFERLLEELGCEVWLGHATVFLSEGCGRTSTESNTAAVAPNAPLTRNAVAGPHQSQIIPIISEAGNTVMPKARLYSP